MGCEKVVHDEDNDNAFLFGILHKCDQATVSEHHFPQESSCRQQQVYALAMADNMHLPPDHEAAMIPHHMREVAVDLLAGMCAGSVNVVVGLPMDTVKVKMQTFPKENPAVFQCFKNTAIKEGIFRGLYAGALPSLVANVGENAVLFVAYGRCQKMWSNLLRYDSVEDMGPVANALSGSSAACFSAMVLCPTEHIKCQLQVRRELSKKNPDMKMTGPYQLTKEIIRRHGIKELYRGIKPTWSREIPGYFFFFGGYEGAKAAICAVTGRQKDDLGLGLQLVCGATAGVTFWTGIFPLDVIKSRIQVMGESGGIAHVARQIFKEYGLAGFYKGLVPCLLRAFPSTASLLATYEYTSRFFSSHII